MQVRVGVTRQIVVDGKIDPLNVNSAPKDIRRNADPLVEFLELLVPLDTVKSSHQLPINPAKSLKRRLTVPPG